jgi:hypothetical protein
MSWSAYACRVKRDPSRENDPPFLALLSKSDEARKAFKVAFDRLSEEGVFGIEYWLQEGSLCSRTTAKAIKAATGLAPYGYHWLPEEVKEIAAKADWTAVDPEGDEGSRRSAKAFFEVCVEQGLGIMCD